MKSFGFIIISFVLFASLFKWFGANLDQNILTLSGMLLLISLFSDLKEFNFWGLWGKKDDKGKELLSLQGVDGVNEDKVHPPAEEKVASAEKNDVIQLMDTDRGNFLTLAFELERQLRIVSSIILDHSNPKMLVNSMKLKEVGFLNENGYKQVESVRWLRNMLVHGRYDEVSEDTVKAGVSVALSLYTEILNWLNANYSSENKTVDI